jgi:hypothetical protein
MVLSGLRRNNTSLKMALGAKKTGAALYYCTGLGNIVFIEWGRVPTMTL